MKQIMKAKAVKPSKPQPIDTRTPSGKTLPY
jgi:hypothetical protein